MHDFWCKALKDTICSRNFMIPVISSYLFLGGPTKIFRKTILPGPSAPAWPSQNVERPMGDTTWPWRASAAKATSLVAEEWTKRKMKDSSWWFLMWFLPGTPRYPTIYKWLAINWMMISNLYIGNGWKSPSLCLRFQVVHPFISGDFTMMASITERINRSLVIFLVGVPKKGMSHHHQNDHFWGYASLPQKIQKICAV